MNEKHLIAAGTPNYLAVKAEYSDEEILEHVRIVYGWEAVTIERKPHIVLVQPENPDLRYTKSGEPTLATMVSIIDRMDL